LLGSDFIIYLSFANIWSYKHKNSQHFKITDVIFEISISLRCRGFMKGGEERGENKRAKG
jgi:hypothetical protein